MQSRRMQNQRRETQGRAQVKCKALGRQCRVLGRRIAQVSRKPLEDCTALEKSRGLERRMGQMKSMELV